MRIFINREQLYEQVWKMPMTKLAPRYNLSNYELKKICDRFFIPTPKVEYWSKISFGKPENIIPLPTCKCYVLSSPKKTVFTQQKKGNNSVVLNTPVNVVELVPKKVDHGIAVKKNLTAPHDLIEKAQQELKSSSPDNYGRCSTRRAIAINVSRNNIKRALLIMDAIFKWFEQRGYKIRKPSYESSQTLILVDGINIEIEIIEKSKVSGKIKSDWGYSYNQYSPTGALTLKINTYAYYSKVQTNWTDGKTQAIEELLDSFIDSVFAIVTIKQNEQKRREQERLLQEERRNIRIYEEKCVQYENQMIDELIKQSNDMAISRRIREYISIVEQKAQSQYSNEDYPKELLDWVKWANNQANNIDPLNQGLPSYFSAQDILKR